MMKLTYQLNRQVAKELAANIKNSIKSQVDCGQTRSKKASLVELGIQLSGFKRMLAEPARLEKALQEASQEAQHPFVLPKDVTNYQRFNMSGVPVVTLNASTASNKIILFLCGGAYFLQPTKDHWHFLKKLAKRTHAKIVVPQHALAPDHTFIDAYQEIATVYTNLYQNCPASDIILMGDSAGGGLAAGFSEWLAQHRLPQPRSLVLISPWLDITLQNPLIPKYAKQDVMLDPAGLRTVGKMWAGNTNLDDYRLSPLNGDVSQLRNVLIFVGTREIMLPDNMTYVEKLRKAQVGVKYEIGRDLYHEYPISPIPESAAAIEQIQNFCFE